MKKFLVLKNSSWSRYFKL